MCSCVRIIFWFMCSCSFNFFLVSFLFSIHLISCLFCLSTSSVVYIFNDLTKSFMYWLSEWVTNCWQTLEILFYKSIIFLAYDKTTLSQLYYRTYIYIWSSGGCAQLFTVECSMNFYCYNKSHPSDSLLYILYIVPHNMSHFRGSRVSFKTINVCLFTHIPHCNCAIQIDVLFDFLIAIASFIRFFFLFSIVDFLSFGMAVYKNTLLSGIHSVAA